MINESKPLKRKVILISLEYDNGDIETQPIEAVDDEYRDSVIEDIEHAANIEDNRRQLRALGFIA